MSPTTRNGSARAATAELLDRQPPMNTDAEECVIGSIILLPVVIDDLATSLKPADFYDEANRILFELLVQMHNDGSKIDTTLLVERLKTAGHFERIGGMAYLAKVAKSVPHAANAIYYASIVRDKAIYRGLIDASSDVMREAYNEEQEPDELLSFAESKVFQLAERRTDADHTKSARDIIASSLEALETRKQRGGVNGLPTGFLEVDKLTGGMKPGEVTILAGRTSMGKTSAACNIAEHAAIDCEVATLFISLEMSVEEIGNRFIASRARVDLQHLKDGTYSRDEQPLLVEAGAIIANSPLFVDDAPTRNMTSIAALSRRHKRQHQIGLIVIDYLQLIDPDNGKDPRQEQVAKIARRLKVLAREIKVPVLCLAQLNRQTEQATNNIPKLSHLRESGAIEQDADVVMFAHRPAYYERRQSGSGQGEQAEIIVAKQRNGPRGIAKVMWFGSYVRFDNAAEFN